MALSIGIDIGGTNLRVGIFNDLTLAHQYRIETNLSQALAKVLPAHVNVEIERLFCEEISFLLDDYPQLEAVGIGFPGFIEPKTGIIVQSPNLTGLNNLNLAQCLKDEFKLKVVVENDANAAAFGEYVLHNKPKEGLIYIGLGTGVGGGLILNGAPLNGANGCAMEIGHIQTTPAGRQCGCGLQGCLEQYASASGVAKSYFEASNKLLKAHEIAALASAGDAQALAAFTLAAESLANALAHILKVVDVPNVVIGGGMCGAWGLMENAFETKLNAELIPVLRGKINVQISTASDTAGMLGAAMLANTLD